MGDNTQWLIEHKLKDVIVDNGSINVSATDLTNTRINPATSDKQLPNNHQVTVSNIASVPVISGFSTEATLAKIPGLSIPIHDYVGAAYNDATFTETYTYKTGGAAGTTVATVTVIYVDATKKKLVSIART